MIIIKKSYCYPHPCSHGEFVFFSAVAPYHSFHCVLWFFVVFLLFFIHNRVWPLVFIADSIRSTFLNDHIIIISHYFLCDTYWRNDAVSHSPDFYPSTMEPYHCLLFCCCGFFSPRWRMLTLVLIVDSIGSTLHNNHLSLYFIISYVTLIGAVALCCILQNFCPSTMAPYYFCRFCCYFLIGSTLLSGHMIFILQYLLCEPYHRNGLVSHYT